LAYHHIRTLLYRPIVAANLGDKGSSAVVAVGDACKHIVQIVQLLDERKLSLSFCLNRNEVLVQAGFGLLFQTLNLARDGKLIKDSNRLVCTVMDMLEHGNAAGYAEFRLVGCSMVTVPRIEQMAAPPALSRNHSNSSMRAPSDTFRATQKTLKAIAARFSPGAGKHSRQDQHDSRRATLPAIAAHMGLHANPSSTSLSSIRSEPHAARSEPSLSPSHRASFDSPHPRRPSQPVAQHRNIDYMSFAIDPLANYAINQNTGIKTEVSSTDWERMLSSLDNGQTNIYDTIYGGPTADALIDIAATVSTAPSSNTSWSPNAWGWNTINEQQQPPQSVLSFSDESLTSGEEFSGNSCEYGSTPGSDRLYSGIMIPDMSTPTALSGLDGNFGL
jgi:hypothetical protein